MFEEKKTQSERIAGFVYTYWDTFLLYEVLMSENSRSAEGRSPGVEGEGDGTGARHCCVNLASAAQRIFHIEKITCLLTFFFLWVVICFSGSKTRLNVDMQVKCLVYIIATP